MKTGNPLLCASAAPFGAPEFNRFTLEDYMPAFRESIARTREEVDAIAACEAAPDFTNTIEALEYAGRELSDLEGIFFNLLEAESDDRMQEIAEEVSPMLTELSVYISLNKSLFNRVRTVYERRSGMDLSREQERLLEKTYRHFTRGGAALQGEDRDLYGKWSEELALAELQFSHHVLSATNAYSLHLTDPAALEGLPESVVEAAAHAASLQGKEGWCFSLQYPSFAPFMKYADRRDLRRELYMAYHSRAIGGEDDNTALIRTIVGLRIKISRLLGYQTYADYALEERMAASCARVDTFLDALMQASLPRARAEVRELEEYARSAGFDGGELQPWDFSYYSEKYRKDHFDLDEEALRPYFRLEDCVDAVFSLAGSLYGLTFEERKDIPVYHEEVRVFEVRDADGSHLALFYADFFPRKGKRGGAWMTEFRGQYACGGTDFRPFISIVTNFTRPTPDRPSLLTHNELTTLLHEFGHALHGMLSRGTYPSLCGTEVARDFVELPSQIMENWAYEPEFLSRFRHYKTGDPLSSEDLRKIVAAKNFQAAYLQVRQLQFGLLDMAWHTLQALPGEGTVDFENRVLAPVRTLPYVPGTAVSPSFGHIFSGGYAAGYYSYKWAEVLDADAFEWFREKGIYNREVAGAFRKNILERGSSEDEAVLYRRFRGRDPQPEALLRSQGLL